VTALARGRLKNVRRQRSSGILAPVLLVLILASGAVVAFVPLVDPPPIPAWATSCDFGETYERITILERARRIWDFPSFGDRH